mmetsp:Transcript_16838/g.23288  ORF Transcript_16838/g.23288 Transcript_16838/m.23288 type:complete len:489 (-) Transcript_16838:19-1485(-)
MGSSFLFFLVVLLPLTQATNTNDCMNLVSSVSSCLDATIIEPSSSSSSECCGVLSEFNELGCYCNLVTKSLVDISLSEKYLEDCEREMMPEPPLLPIIILEADCEPFKTYTYHQGDCPYDDMTLDAIHLQSLSNLGEFAKYNFEEGLDECLDIDVIDKDLSESLSDNVTTLTPFGLTFRGRKSFLGSFIFTYPFLSNSFIKITDKPQQNSDEIPYHILSDGSLLTSSNISSVSLSQGKNGWDDPDFVFELEETLTDITMFSFSSCSPKMSEIVYLNGIIELTVAWMKNFILEFPKYGLENVCHIHERVCHGELKQFQDFNHCMNFMTDLPFTSPSCGTRFLGGNSSLCRISATMMGLHDPRFCYYLGTGFEDGRMMCSDQSDCGDEEADSSSSSHHEALPDFAEFFARARDISNWEALFDRESILESARVQREDYENPSFQWTHTYVDNCYEATPSSSSSAAAVVVAPVLSCVGVTIIATTMMGLFLL